MKHKDTSDGREDGQVQQAAGSESRIAVFDETQPLRLDSGNVLCPFQIAYQTYGTLNANKSNAIVICHPLTGDQHVANPHPVTGKPGWWDNLVGPGKVVDTRHYFVICSNVIGGSMGGMQALQWASACKERVFAAVILASGARHSAQNIAFGEIGRQAVMADPDWRGGRYIEAGTNPRKGLAVARMTAHITYLSEAALHRKFGRNLHARARITFGFDADFQIESYLRHQGLAFVERFDANSYLYLTRAMDYFDLAAGYDGCLAHAFHKTATRFFIASFSSDWLFPTRESRSIVHALNAAGASVSFAEIATDKGHDAFLLHEPTMFSAVGGFLQSAARARGLAPLNGQV